MKITRRCRASGGQRSDLCSFSSPAGSGEPLRSGATRTAWRLCETLWRRYFNGEVSQRKSNRIESDIHFLAGVPAGAIACLAEAGLERALGAGITAKLPHPDVACRVTVCDHSGEGEGRAAFAVFAGEHLPVSAGRRPSQSAWRGRRRGRRLSVLW